MLITDIGRYLSLRRALGFKLQGLAASLRAFAKFAGARGGTHVRTATATHWAAGGSSPRIPPIFACGACPAPLVSHVPRMPGTRCPRAHCSAS